MSVQYGGDKITFADGSTVASSWSGFKNRIINGDMRIDQRNAGAAVVDSAGSSPYCVDRWRVITRTGATITAQQSTTGSSTVRWHQAITITSAKASPASADQFRLAQSIEGLNIADFWFGSANAAPYITLSFWSCHSQTGTFSGALFNGTNDRSFVFTYTQNAANTWEYKTVVVPGATSGTWAIDNTNGMNVSFDYGSGSLFETATTGSWLSGIYLRASSSMSPVQTTGAIFRITGVQVEKGSTATSFDYRPYGTELALCQRYCYVITTAAAQVPLCMSANYSSVNPYGVLSFPVTMRTAPTTTFVTPTNWNITGSGTAVATTIAQGLATPYSTEIYGTSTGLTAGAAGWIRANGSSTNQIINSSEM